ncbi:uncharacterized protein LOC125854376 [Solanum stenotomum]|uniref:uncharacterized protein LOC125854376 n=1 Tax=Solanum stenotomum TaxID=172797 RepID=UPI0020D0B9D1|nr:uncharacterized protein LOC125854376 [Solanum stenotomum]
MAEYEASILDLKMVQGEWAVKNPKITPYVRYIQKLCKRFRKIEFRHTPRTHNELVDALPTIASMIKHPDTSYIHPVDIEVKEQPVHCSHVEAEPDGLPWYFDIKKRTLNLGLLRCVDANEAAKLLDQIHAGVCGTHMSGLTLARKILHTGLECQNPSSSIMERTSILT